MVLRPISTAYIAKLMFTSACYMITALIFLYDKFAIWALPIMKVVLKKIDLILITRTRMLLKIAFRTELSLTFIAYPRLILNNFNNSLAILLWTQSQARIFWCFVKVMYFNVLSFCVFWKAFIEIILLIYNELALFVWTNDFLKHVDFIQNVLVETTGTKKVVTISYSNPLIFFHLSQAYSTLLKFFS
jgi:hypothetical protein